MINPEIERVLKNNRIRKDDGLCYLLSLYYNLNVDFIPADLKAKVYTSGIIEITSKGTEWNIVLFDNIESSKFDWVKTQYVNLFAFCGKDKNAKEATERMKDLFRNNPDIRKDEIIGATKLYLASTAPLFIRLPHYFITKGIGKEKIQDILTWIDKYRQAEEVYPTHVTNTIQ